MGQSWEELKTLNLNDFPSFSPLLITQDPSICQTAVLTSKTGEREAPGAESVDLVAGSGLQTQLFHLLCDFEQVIELLSVLAHVLYDGIWNVADSSDLILSS